MSTLDLDENLTQYQIRSYQPGRIQINNRIFTRSLIVTPDKLIENWSPQSMTELQCDSFTIIQSLRPDVLLLGTGTTLVFVPIELYGELINHGIGVEIMDTHAACRTYNALTAEERKVAAALIIQ